MKLAQAQYSPQIVAGSIPKGTRFKFHTCIGGFQPIPRDPKDNCVAAMLENRTFCFVIRHGRHTVVFLDLQGLVANHLLAACAIST